MNSYICIDLETTGLSPKHDKIIEVGAVRVIEGEIVDSLSQLVNPGRVLDERVVELTGIRDDDLKDAPAIDKVIGKIADFCGDLPLVGHRIIFDFSFLKQAAVNAGINFEKDGVDTLKISRVCFPELPSKRLSDMCEHYGISINAHRALNDVYATVELYKCLCRDFEDKYFQQFKPARLIYNVKKESPIRPGQIEKIQAILDRYGIPCQYDLSKMTRNEASRYYDKLRAEYNKQ